MYHELYKLTCQLVHYELLTSTREQGQLLPNQYMRTRMLMFSNPRFSLACHCILINNQATKQGGNAFSSCFLVYIFIRKLRSGPHAFKIPHTRFFYKFSFSPEIVTQYFFPVLRQLIHRVHTPFHYCDSFLIFRVLNINACICNLFLFVKPLLLTVL